MFSVQHQIDV